MTNSSLNNKSLTEVQPAYKSYEHQKCFIAHSYDSPSEETILNTCKDVLPVFNLEPWYASLHSEQYQQAENIQYDTEKSPLEKVIEMIANARYGIYDLTMWQDKEGVHSARNVFIELGIAIGLNRPALLLYSNNKQSLRLPDCLAGLEIIKFSGEITLKEELQNRLPNWIETPPERDWWNRYCHFGQRVCEYREVHPRERQWGKKNIACHIFLGNDPDLKDFKVGVENIIDRYGDVETIFVDKPALHADYNFKLCTTCQHARSGLINIYRLTENLPPEAFISIGISIAEETQFGYKIPKIFISEDIASIPALLTKYEILIAENDTTLRSRLKVSIPSAINQVRQTAWKPTSLPFAEPLHNDPSLVKPETKNSEIEFIEDKEEFPAIARLIELGRQQTYVTLDDIISFFPEAENDANQLDEVFSALLSAGIPFQEDVTANEPSEAELIQGSEQEQPTPLNESATSIAKSQLDAVLIQLSSQRVSEVWRGMDQVRQWLKEDPENRAVYGLLMDAAQKNSALREQVRTLLTEMMQSGSQSAEKAMLSLPSSLQDLLADADDAYYAGEYKKAIQLYRQALKLDPENARAKNNLAIAEKRITGESSTSLPRTAIQFYRRARSYIAARDFSTAASLLNAAIEAAEEKGLNYPEAEEILSQIQNLALADNYSAQAKNAVKKRQFDDAVVLYKKALVLDPTNSEIQKEIDSLQNPLQRLLKRFRG